MQASTFLSRSPVAERHLPQEISPRVRACNVQSQKTSNGIGRIAAGQERRHTLKPSFRPYLLHRRCAKLVGPLVVFGVVEVLLLDLAVGIVNPVLGKKPSVPDNKIARLQLRTCQARPAFCRVAQVLQPAEPGERKPANPFAEDQLWTRSSTSESAHASIKSQTKVSIFLGNP